jgi:hypothetical protein
MQDFGMLPCNARQTTNSISTYTHQSAYSPLSTVAIAYSPTAGESEAFTKVMEDGDDLLSGKTTS